MTGRALTSEPFDCCAEDDVPAVGVCAHCGQPAAARARFCCKGCEAAFALVRGLELERYYERRCLDAAAGSLRPDAEAPLPDFDAAVQALPDGGRVLHLMVDGLQCAACVWLIEQVLARQPGVVSARLNMTTRRLAVRLAVDARAAAALAPVLALGYRLAPFDPGRLHGDQAREESELLRALAVAGFAAGNVMLLSVSVWAGHAQGMGPATRDLLHGVSALIALPAIAYAGVPFFRSALSVLRHGRVNMDVPISLGVILAAAVSVAETMSSGLHAYFDSAITLLFFLLVGRYLERRARGRARRAAEHLLGLRVRAATVRDEDGRRRLVAAERIAPGMTILVAAGERLAADGRVTEGHSDLDVSLITGESAPQAVAPGAAVFAGTLNVGAPIAVRVSSAGEGTLLAEIVRLMEAAEQGRARHVALADRVARAYAPVVHTLAAATFAGWWLGAGVPWTEALTIAVAVLIVTCPCALALAVPAVQVAATGRLMRQGILVKSPTALERIAEVDTIVFDKTGTLTLGRPELRRDGRWTTEDLRLAAGLAGLSRHPLARALARAAPDAPLLAGVVEEPGRGLTWSSPEGEARLGSREFIGIAATEDAADAAPEMWLAAPGRAPARFSFADEMRADARETVARLRARGFALVLLSGDRAGATRAVAEALGIADWTAAADPKDKVARLRALAEQGKKVLMVGDGLNDAPALQSAHASLSPSAAADVAQTAADAVFQGDRLMPVAETVAVAARAARLVRQNFALSFGYNLITIPLAVLGLVTPLIAAAAMSASSLAVIGNALRVARRGG